MRSLSLSALFLVSLLAACGVAACQGCRAPAGSPASDGPLDIRPTVRLYISSTIAGAVEPCGCTKDMLGGIDHLAAWVKSERQAAPASLVVGAGPMLFIEPRLRAGDTSQDTWKAQALAESFKAIGFAAWAPGFNDWAGGAGLLMKCRDDSGAALLAGNVAGLTGTMVREVGGVKIGLVGVSDPKDRGGVYPEGVRCTPARAAMKAGLEEVKGQGARILVGLAALPRGEALRLADALPELNVLVVGKSSEAGEGNDAAKPPVLAGSTLVVETANHLQTVSVVDLYVRSAGSGPIVFADAGGVARADELLSMSSRIHDLEVRINSWERDKNVKPEDVVARRADLEKLRADKVKLEAERVVVKGSFFQYKSVEVRDEMGVADEVRAALRAYYKRVNEHNKEAFADRRPVPVEEGQARYTGMKGCTDCHEEERKVWDKTQHAQAYATLQRDFKEYNLECVGCHVTGYDKPGGSTVTFVEKLKDVQCEACHGPGSLHAKEPERKELIVAKPTPYVCAGCHHPPHVEGFDGKEKMPLILGPGHGVDAGAPP